MNTLILALGNPILSDDAIGWVIADRLAAELPSTDYHFMKESGATLDLLPKLAGYGRLVVIDAIQLGSKPVGTVHQFSLDELQSTIRHSSPHDLNFATAFAMGRKLGYQMPADIRIFAIEVKDLTHFAEHLSPELNARVPVICSEIQSAISQPHQ